MARFRVEIHARRLRVPGDPGVITEIKAFPRQRAMRQWIAQQFATPQRGVTRTAYLFDTKGEWTILDVVKEEDA